MLRGYSDDQSKQIFPGSPGTSGSHASRAGTILCIPVGGIDVDCQEDRLYAGDVVVLV
jgi:hypothetical protein